MARKIFRLSHGNPERLRLISSFVVISVGTALNINTISGTAADDFKPWSNPLEFIHL